MPISCSSSSIVQTVSIIAISAISLIPLFIKQFSLKRQPVFDFFTESFDGRGDELRSTLPSN
jgi:hypothetical protein